MITLFRCTSVWVTTGIVCSTSAAESDVEAFIDRLRDAHKISFACEFTRRESRVEDSAQPSSHAAPTAEIGSSILVSVSNTGDVLANATHLLQRKAGIGPSGMLFSGE
jgi:hypothetical protein